MASSEGPVAMAVETPAMQAPSTSGHSASETQPILPRELKLCTKNRRRFLVLMVYGILSAQFLTATLVALAFGRPLADQIQQFNVVVVGCLALMVATVFFALYLSGHLRTWLINIFMLVTVPCGIGCVLGFVDAFMGWQAGFLILNVLSITFLVLAVLCYATYWDLVKKNRGVWLLVLSVAVAALSFAGVGITLWVLKTSIHWYEITMDIVIVFVFLAHVTHDLRMMTEGIHEAQLDVDEYCYAVLLFYIDIIELLLWPMVLYSKQAQPEQKKEKIDEP